MQGFTWLTVMSCTLSLSQVPLQSPARKVASLPITPRSYLLVDLAEPRELPVQMSACVCTVMP